MKRAAALSLAWILLCLCCPALGERQAIPDVLRFSQSAPEREYVKDQLYIQRTYPQTANSQINQDMRALIDGMAERGRAHLPTGRIELMPAYLDVGAEIRRTGDRWMSFLTVARIAYEREQIYVDFDARVYDMKSGEQLTLDTLFSPDSAGWDALSSAVREQLSAYFMDEQADGAALEALCSREEIARTPFTLTPGKLSLHYRADQLYPGKNTLMHVNLYYSALRPLMTEAGREITDNSKYQMIALTYDDGGGRGSSMNLMNELRAHGADATFFIVGNMIIKNHDVLCRQQDAGFTLASHNYHHVYRDVTVENLASWKKRFDREMDGVVGVRPGLMRAPGGYYKTFINAGADYPMIQWNIASGDVGNQNVKKIAGVVLENAVDGSVVLMHDINASVASYNAIILTTLEQRNFMCVTVEELFDHYGVELLPNQVYFSCVQEASEQ